MTFTDVFCQQGSGAPPGGAPSAESLDAILQSLGDLGLGEGGDEDAELAGFLETMMGQLMSKEVLYEPLKELADGVCLPLLCFRQ